MADHPLITRRAVLAGGCALPFATLALPAPAAPMPSQAALDRAYNNWLHYERLCLMMELYPHVDPHDALQVVPENAGIGQFHRDTWWPARNAAPMPMPSSRAATVLQAAGVDLGTVREVSA